MLSLHFDPILDVLKASLFVGSTPEGAECGKGKETALRITGKCSYLSSPEQLIGVIVISVRGLSFE